MNTTVTATGMEVKATSSASLAISADNVTYSNTMTLATNTSQLNPVSLVDNNTSVIGPTTTTDASASTATTTDLSFYRIDYTSNTVNNPNNYAATVSLATYLSDTTTYADYFQADTTNYVTDDLWLKYTAESGTKAANLKITITHPTASYADVNEYNAAKSTLLDASAFAALSAAEKSKNSVADFGRDMENAFHFAFVDASGKVWNYDVTNFTDTDTNSDGIYDAYVHEITSFVTLTAGTPTKYTVYGWYEGEDLDCTTAKAISVTDLVVDLEFTLVP